MSSTVKPFANEVFQDFSRPEVEARYREGLAAVRAKLGRTYPLVIGGARVDTGDTFDSRDPSRKDEVVGRFAKARPEHVESAIAAAWQAFPAWSATSAADRAGLLFRVAGVLRDRRFEMMAWLTLEVGKNRREADADVAEAIDFCEFYARDVLRLAGEQPLTPLSGEQNELQYIPLGVGVIIPPWNFPLAILCGMVVAAIGAGNTVVLKPSSDAPAIAYVFVEVLEQAGMPAGVVNLLSGPGGAIGDLLVDHPRTRFVAFTGSKEVGLRINERAAKAQPGQRWIKRVVCEMGGKDAIVVDRDADLDAAVEGVVASAFGYQGQKCSACSRAIVDSAVYQPFLAKLKTAVEKVAVGPADDPGAYMGPVVNAKSQEKVLQYVEAGKKEGKLLTGGEAGDPAGYYVKPAVFYDVPRDGKLAQEEIFGPVLAVIEARDFDDALAIANDTEFGLTGSVYSADREKLERAKREFHVGNLYLNRKCTGALVGVHPFGGFNMSGTDSKAGGHDYLLLFTQAKAIAEKLK